MEKKYKKLLLSIKKQEVNDALLAYFDLVRQEEPEKDIVKNILKELIPRLYRTKYFHVPHGFMGLTAAMDLSKYLSKYKHLPVAEAIYYLTRENKLAPLDFSDFHPLYSEAKDPIDSLEEYIQSGDVPKAYRTFIGLQQKELINEQTHLRLFKSTLKDSVNLGHKSIYYHKTLELIDFLGEDIPNIFYPCLSYLASEPKDYKIYEAGFEEYQTLMDTGADFSGNNKELTKESSNTLIETILYSMKSSVLKHLTKRVQDGYSIKSLSDNLTLAAAQLLLDTETSDWIKPLHAFNFCYALNWWIEKSGIEDQLLALYIKASLINQYSIELKKVHFLSSPFYANHENIVCNIIRAIELSNVSDAVLLTQSFILSGLDIDYLSTQMAFLAARNGSIINFTHDMKLCSSCLSEYKTNESPNKWLILVALAKHLAQSEKDYTCFDIYLKTFQPTRQT